MIEQVPLCGKCGAAMRLEMEHTMGGVPMRSYSCLLCGVVTTVCSDRGRLMPELEGLSLPAAPATRTERLANLQKALARKAEELEEMREEWDFMLGEHYHPYLRRKTNRYYEPRVKELEQVIAVLQARCAQVRDELDESPDEAGKRDGFIAWLEEHWEDKA